MKFLIFIVFVLCSQLKAQTYNDCLTFAGNGMLVQKYRLKVIAENIANVSTHMTDRGEPYRKKIPLVVPDEKGAKVAGIAESQAPFGKVYDPSHVFSDKNGFLYTPNFELNDEMVNLAYTNLVYEGNTTAFKSCKQMFQNTLELLK